MKKPAVPAFLPRQLVCLFVFLLIVGLFFDVHGPVGFFGQVFYGAAREIFGGGAADREAQVGDLGAGPGGDGPVQGG